MTKTTLRLNDLQLVMLASAATRGNGSLIPLPESCSHDATRIGKAIASLLRRSLVEQKPVSDRTLAWRDDEQDMIGLFITQAGRDAIGAGHDEQTGDAGSSEHQAALSDTAPPGGAGGETTDSTMPAAPSPRAGSKIAAVIALLERKEGAVLDEMVDATGWQPHTTRAALTGLRKKGHTIAKSKRGDLTCYRIAAQA